jgi:hypothetical protein
MGDGATAGSDRGAASDLPVIDDFDELVCSGGAEAGHVPAVFSGSGG